MAPPEQKFVIVVMLDLDLATIYAINEHAPIKTICDYFGSCLCACKH